MRDNSRKIAVGGMMTALAVAVMLLGGAIPVATFCCPAIAGVLLLPVVAECGRRIALGAYAAIAALSLILCPDKEAALLFAFVGYYPVVKWSLDRIRRKWLRRGLKALILNGAIALMYALVFFVFRLDQIMADYADMTRAMLIAMAVIGNITLALYDVMLGMMAFVYVEKLRPKLFGRGGRR